MAEPKTLIPGPFGSERVPVAGVSDPIVAGTTSPGEESRVPFNDEAVKTQPGFRDARAGREARAAREDSTTLEGIGAAIDSWDTTRLVRRLARPRFDGDAPLASQHEALENLPMVLTEDERDYILDVGVGQQSFQYAVDQVRNRRQAVEVMGDHPVASLATAFADPLWLVVPPAVRLGKVSPLAGRLVSGATAGALGGAVTALGEGPVSDQEIAMSLVLNAAVGTALYSPGKGLQAPKTAFPTKAADEAIAAATAGADAAAKPRYKLVKPAEYEEVDIPGTPAKFELQAQSLPALDTAQPRYKSFEVAFENPIDKAAYIITGKGKSAKHDEILTWATTQAGVTPEQLVKHGNDIRNDLKVKSQNAAAGSQVASMVGPFAAKRVPREIAPAIPGRKERVLKSEAVFEELPKELQPGGTIDTTPAAVAGAVDTAVAQDAKARGIGEKVMWNMHKTMTGYGPVGKKVADLIYDNNADLSITSMESHREAIMSGLRTHLYDYGDDLRKAMAEDGFGLFKTVNPFTSRQAYAAQARIEREVQQELFRREQFSRDGVPLTSEGVPARITAMADKLDAMHKRALAEMKAAGVEGAENLLERPGYLNRKWSSQAIDNTLDRLKAMGLTSEKALDKVHDLVALSLRRVNNLEPKLAKQVGSAIVDRALRRGYFEDSLFNAPAGEGQLKQLRDILKDHMSNEDLERALDVLRVESDEAGKAGFMKHRMDLDYKAKLRVGDMELSIMDLIDSRIHTITDQYVQRVSTSAAFARKGLKKRSDIEALREELLHDIKDTGMRERAQVLFDNTFAYYQGNPNGAKVDENFRLIQSYGRSIALAWSGLWQMTEFANAMGEFGLRTTLKYAAQEIPGFKQIMKTDAETARSLNNVLAEHSSASLRLRPYLARYEDGFEMDTSSALQLGIQSAGQLVPYANAMKFVHHKQAQIVGNLILDRLDKAGKGDIKAREALRKYGLEYHVMDKLSGEIQKHGYNVDAWSDDVWHNARPAFAKMMDASVLKSRLGDVPAFAQFDQLGKFVFTYRTFVLTAHNKVLAGTAARDGTGAVGLVLLYQFPLALAAVQAQNTIKGEPADTDKLVKQALGQMGGLGLFSEPLKWATGQSNAVGSPAMIPVDRAVKLFQAGTNLDAQQGASAAITMLPVISANPFIRGMEARTKE